MNIVGAYLESLLGETVSPIYMEVLQKLKSGRIRLVCCILQSLYGLKQAEKLWNKKFVKFSSNLGFVATNRDPCILLYEDLINDIIIMVGIYVDDIVIASNCDKAKDKIKMQLSQEYQMKDLGKVEKIIR